MPEITKNGLSTKAKAAIGAGVAAVLALGITLAVWQPWKQPEPPAEPDTQPEDTLPPETPEEPGLSVRVSGEDVPCALYEGEGWSVYVPQGWEAAGLGGGKGVSFTAPDGGVMSVAFTPAGSQRGSFVSLSAGDGEERQLQFYSDTALGGLTLTGAAPREQWVRYEKLFPALAKTMAVGEDTPFAASYVLPHEPDWQLADGSTVLFLDKDGVILDETVQEAVERYMRAWPEEDRASYTGQYRINGIDWAASYTGLTEGYIDVFRARVQYRVAEGVEEAVKARPGVSDVVDGWASLDESVCLALTHDGGSVEKTQDVIWSEPNDWIGFAGELK